MNENFNHGLVIGEKYTNEKVRTTFKCSTQGGMRRSKSTNSLVLVTDHTKSLYDDRWEGDELFYTGMGKSGDQSLSFMQNDTLHKLDVYGVKAYYLEVWKKNEYKFIGQVDISNPPFQEPQTGEDKKSRKAWVFRLKLVSEEHDITYLEEDILRVQKSKARKASKLTTEELENIVSAIRTKGERKVSSKKYDRNPAIAVLACRYAKGICQLCQNLAPFNRPDGTPYLESHHVEWLSREGYDEISNCVGVCPNCHKKMHVVDDEKDVKKLKDILNQRNGEV